MARWGPTLAARVPLLGPLLGLPLADNELTRAFDAKLRKDRLQASALRGLNSPGSDLVVFDGYLCLFKLG